MKLRVVSSKSEIGEVSKNEQMVHLAFRASNTDIFRLFQNCPRLRAIQVPASYRKTLSRASEMFLDMQGVELIEGDVWGHRKDINEYYMVNEGVLNRIKQLQENGAETIEIASTISKETRLSPELVRYMIKQSA
ncbi:MAG: DUF1699 family protein [Methanotrichaceae archaeon]|nr:DUF1699 family protein [Methanotrichaceae archaeon]